MPRRRILPQDIEGGNRIRPSAGLVNATPSGSPAALRAATSLAPLSSQLANVLVSNFQRKQEDAIKDVSTVVEDLGELSAEEFDAALKDLPQARFPKFIVSAKEAFGARTAENAAKTLMESLAAGDYTEIDHEGNAPDYVAMMDKQVEAARETLTDKFTRRGFEATMQARRLQVENQAIVQIQERLEEFGRHATTSEVTGEIMRIAESGVTTGLEGAGEGIVEPELFSSLRTYAEGLKNHDWRDVRAIISNGAYVAIERIAEQDPEKALEVADALGDFELNGRKLGEDATPEGERLRRLEYKLNDRVDEDRRKVVDDNRVEIEKILIDFRANPEGEMRELLRRSGDPEAIEEYARQVSGTLVDKYGSAGVDAEREFGSAADTLLRQAEALGDDSLDTELVGSLVRQHRDDPTYDPFNDPDLRGHDGEAIAVSRELERIRDLQPFLTTQKYKTFVSRNFHSQVAASEKLTPTAGRNLRSVVESSEEAFDAAYQAKLREWQGEGLQEAAIKERASDWLATEASRFREPIDRLLLEQSAARKQFSMQFSTAQDQLADHSVEIDRAFAQGVLTDDEHREARQANIRAINERRQYNAEVHELAKAQATKLDFYVRNDLASAGLDLQQQGVLVENAIAAFNAGVNTRVAAEIGNIRPGARAEWYRGVYEEVYNTVREQILSDASKRFAQRVEEGEAPTEAAEKAQAETVNAVDLRKSIQESIDVDGIARFSANSPFLNAIRHKGAAFDARPYDEFAKMVRHANGNRWEITPRVTFTRFNRSVVGAANQAIRNVQGDPQRSALMDLVKLRGVPSTVLLSASKTYTFDLSPQEKKALAGLRERLGIEGEPTDAQRAFGSFDPALELKPVSFILDDLDDPWNIYIDFGRPVDDVPKQTITKVLTVLRLEPEQAEAWIAHQRDYIAPMYRR